MALVVRSIPQTDTVQIGVDAEFDVVAAWRLVEAVSQHAHHAAINVDFSHAALDQDFALAVLTQALQRLAHAPVHAHGLGEHPTKLLLHLGIDPGTLRPAVA